MGEFIVQGFVGLTTHMSEHSTETIPASDFITLAYHSLSQLEITDNDSFDQIKAGFENLANYSFSKEDRFIAELHKNNEDKFATLKAIIEYEQAQNKKDRESLEQDIYATTFRPIMSDVASYNDKFEVHNARLADAAVGLLTGQNHQANDLNIE